MHECTHHLSRRQLLKHTGVALTTVPVLSYGLGTAAARSHPSIPLLAGRHTEVGTLDIDLSGEEVTVSYDTGATAWYLDETHLHIGASLEDVPRTPTGNPIIGQFDHTGEEVTDGGTKVVYHGLGVPEGTDELIIAAHAVVSQSGEHDTAWADGEPFIPSGKGSWATYVSLSTRKCISLNMQREAQYIQLRDLDLWDPFILEMYAVEDGDVPLGGERDVLISVTNHHGSLDDAPTSIAHGMVEELPFTDGRANISIGGYDTSDPVDLTMPCSVEHLCEVNHIETIDVLIDNGGEVTSLYVCQRSATT